MCIRSNNAGKWTCGRLIGDADFGKKKSSFQIKLILIWGTENPHAYFKKPTHPKRVTVWCGFWFRGIIGPFFFENEQGEAVIVNGDCYRAMLNEFVFTKIEEEEIGNNRTTLGSTQPKLHSMFCSMLLKMHYQPQS